MVAKVRVRGSWEGDPTDPGWYVKCTDGWVGPFPTEAGATARRDSIDARPVCGHMHTVVPVGLHDDTASGTVTP